MNILTAVADFVKMHMKSPRSDMIKGMIETRKQRSEHITNLLKDMNAEFECIRHGVPNVDQQD